MSTVKEEMTGVVQDIIVSYEARISIIGTLIDNTHRIMQESKAALGQINAQLRETLADSVSLRKKDYDSMIAEIESLQEERYREIKGLLNEFILVHKEMASRLKGLFDDARGGKAVDFRKALADIQARQDEAQNRVISQLSDSQQEQEAFMSELRKLLDNGGSVKARDFKAAISRSSARRKEYISQ